MVRRSFQYRLDATKKPTSCTRMRRRTEDRSGSLKRAANTIPYHLSELDERDDQSLLKRRGPRSIGVRMVATSGRSRAVVRFTECTTCTSSTGTLPP